MERVLIHVGSFTAPQRAALSGGRRILRAKMTVAKCSFKGPDVPSITELSAASLCNHTHPGERREPPSDRKMAQPADTKPVSQQAGPRTVSASTAETLNIQINQHLHQLMKDYLQDMQSHTMTEHHTLCCSFTKAENASLMLHTHTHTLSFSISA